jgi:hypothetical protein
MPDLNPFDVDLEGDVAGSHSGRPWREAPLLHSEAVSQTGRGYGESGVALASGRCHRQDKQSTPGATRTRAHGFGGRCSIRLSYGGTFVAIVAHRPLSGNPTLPT